MQNQQAVTNRHKKASDARTSKASYLKVVPNERNTSMNNSTAVDINNQVMPKPPKNRLNSNEYAYVFSIIRNDNGIIKRMCTFLDEDNVLTAYKLIKKIFPEEKINICDEAIEREGFSFWFFARKHIKSLRKVNQLVSLGVAA